MKFFVTGAAGFVGQNFIRTAASHGHEIVALCNHRPMDLPIEKLCASHHMGGFTSFQPNMIDGAESVINFGAHSTNAPYATNEACIQSNVLDLYPLANHCEQEQIPFYQIGSCFEFGAITSKLYEFIPADAPMHPVGSYPLSKAMSTLALLSLAQQGNLALSILRLFQIYGPGEAPNRLYPQILEQGEQGLDLEISSGQQVRHFTHVNEASQQILDAVAGKKAQKSRIHLKNIASGTPLTLKHFVNEIWLKNDYKGKIIFGAKELRANEPMRIAADLTEVLI